MSDPRRLRDDLEALHDDWCNKRQGSPNCNCNGINYESVLALLDRRDDNKGREAEVLVRSPKPRPAGSTPATVATTEELRDLRDRIKDWCESDTTGYDAAIALLCDAKFALDKLLTEGDRRDAAAPPDLAQALADFAKKLTAEQKPLPPEFAKVLHDNYWDLLTADPRVVPATEPKDDVENRR